MRGPTVPDLSPRGLYRLARHAVVFEYRLYRSLVRWVVRRPDHGGPEEEPFTYARSVAPALWLWIFASAAEVPLMHLLLPWDSARLALLVLGIWGLVWMVGLLASLYVYPHLMGPRELRVRNGASHDVTVRWDQVDSIAYHRRDATSSVWALQPRQLERGVELQVVASGQVNVRVRLRGPTIVSTAKGGMEIVELSFFADDPRPLVAHARKLLAAHANHTG